MSSPDSGQYLRDLPEHDQDPVDGDGFLIGRGSETKEQAAARIPGSRMRAWIGRIARAVAAAASGSVLAYGRVSVNPGRINAATDLDGAYQVIMSLTDAEVTALTSAGVNYLEVWFGTETVHVVSPWVPALATRIDAVVDTTEETEIGAPGQALAVRVVYRVNKEGSQTYYAEGAGALRVGGFDATAAGDDLQSVTVSSLASFNNALTAQATADTPLEIVFAQQLVLTSGPNAGTYAVGDVVFVAPHSTSIERRFNAASHTNLRDEAELRQKGDTIISFDAANAAQLRAILNTAGDEANVARITAGFTTATSTYETGQRWYLAPHHTTEANLVLLSEGRSAPFAEITLLPNALPGSQVPDNIFVELTDKLTTREIDGLTLNVQGQTFQPHASTPIADFNTETQAIVRFDISASADAITNGINSTTEALTVDLTFSFKTGDDYRRRITMAVNNPNAARLVQGKLDSIDFNAALTLDWLAPDMRTVTLTGNITFAFSNIQVGRPLVLEVKQGTPGGQTITWPSSVEWAGGSAQGPSSGAGAVDIFTLLPLSKTRVIASALLDVK